MYFLMRDNIISHMSLPSRERGLKSRLLGLLHRDAPVAPFAGAWIEIQTGTASYWKPRSLPSRERGLKLHDIVQNLLLPGRSLRGSVD